MTHPRATLEDAQHHRELALAVLTPNEDSLLQSDRRSAVASSESDIAALTGAAPIDG